MCGFNVIVKVMYFRPHLEDRFVIGKSFRKSKFDQFFYLIKIQSKTWGDMFSCLVNEIIDIPLYIIAAYAALG